MRKTMIEVLGEEENYSEMETPNMGGEKILHILQKRCQHLLPLWSIAPEEDRQRSIIPFQAGEIVRKFKNAPGKSGF